MDSGNSFGSISEDELCNMIEEKGRCLRDAGASYISNSLKRGTKKEKKQKNKKKKKKKKKKRKKKKKKKIPLTSQSTPEEGKNVDDGRDFAGLNSPLPKGCLLRERGGGAVPRHI